MTARFQTNVKSLDWYNRYARHIALEEVGESGQEILNRTSVLVVGTGGLGSPVAIYLAAAGVGTLALVDYDSVTLNNLQRQILYGTSDLDRLKIESAQETLHNINPDVTLHTVPDKFLPANAWDLIHRYDLIVDCSDNFATRFLLNDVCVQAGKPLVFGAVLQFAGQVTVFTQESDCGCYRCLFAQAPTPDQIPTCAEAGIFGVIPGVIGSLQATEALKIALSLGGNPVGKVLKNRLLIFDGKSADFRIIRLRKNPDCPVCGDPKFDYRQVRYSEVCSVDVQQDSMSILTQISDDESE